MVRKLKLLCRVSIFVFILIGVPSNLVYAAEFYKDKEALKDYVLKLFGNPEVMATARNQAQLNRRLEKIPDSKDPNEYVMIPLDGRFPDGISIDKDGVILVPDKNAPKIMLAETGTKNAGLVYAEGVKTGVVIGLGFIGYEKGIVIPKGMSALLVSVSTSNTKKGGLIIGESQNDVEQQTASTLAMYPYKNDTSFLGRLSYCLGTGQVRGCLWEGGQETSGSTSKTLIKADHHEEQEDQTQICGRILDDIEGESNLNDVMLWGDSLMQADSGSAGVRVVGMGGQQSTFCVAGGSNLLVRGNVGGGVQVTNGAVFIDPRARVVIDGRPGGAYEQSKGIKLGPVGSVNISTKASGRLNDILPDLDPDSLCVSNHSEYGVEFGDRGRLVASALETQIASYQNSFAFYLKEDANKPIGCKLNDQQEYPRLRFSGNDKNFNLEEIMEDDPGGNPLDVIIDCPQDCPRSSPCVEGFVLLEENSSPKDPVVSLCQRLSDCMVSEIRNKEDILRCFSSQDGE